LSPPCPFSHERIDTNAQYDHIDPKDRVMAKKMIRPVRTESEYDQALEEIERYFESFSRL
jgi:hypothetical protein